jgi:hypothetical protein
MQQWPRRDSKGDKGAVTRCLGELLFSDLGELVIRVHSQ